MKVGAHPTATELDRAVGEVLRSRRMAAGISQSHLAIQANLHRTYISQLERGLKSPTLHTLTLLSKALGISPSTLLQEAERQPLAGFVRGL